MELELSKLEFHVFLANSLKISLINQILWRTYYSSKYFPKSIYLANFAQLNVFNAMHIVSQFMTAPQSSHYVDVIRIFWS